MLTTRKEMIARSYEAVAIVVKSRDKRWSIVLCRLHGKTMLCRSTRSPELVWIGYLYRIWRHHGAVSARRRASCGAGCLSRSVTECDSSCEFCHAWTAAQRRACAGQWRTCCCCCLTYDGQRHAGFDTVSRGCQPVCLTFYQLISTLTSSDHRFWYAGGSCRLVTFAFLLPLRLLFVLMRLQHKIISILLISIVVEVLYQICIR